MPSSGELDPPPSTTPAPPLPLAVPVPGEATSAVAGAALATSVVGVGMMAMNALAYLFTLLSARLLGPRDFGGVSALLGVLIVANVGSLTLQATAARRLATADQRHLAGVGRDIVRNAWGVAAGLGLAFLAASPLLNAVLHLHDWLAAALVGAATVPLTLMGAFAGIVQGQRRWIPLATVYVAMGAGRVVGGTVALVIQPSLRSAMVGVAVGSLVPAVLGWTYCRTPAFGPSDHAPVLGELWRNGHTLLAFFAFTNLDVLLARHLFSSHDAGIYAAGSILAKACLFLPTFVLVVAFPSMATQRGRRVFVGPLVAVLGLGLMAVAAVAVLPDLAVTFAGGSEYADLGHVAWLFALEGTIFAALQILVYDAIAGQAHSAFLLWLGALILVGIAVPLVDSVRVLVALAALIAFGIGLVTSLMPGATHPD
jgi:O-antigen/teichoic acid export membrane protein